MARLRELHIQGNRLSVLPPELGLKFNIVLRKEVRHNIFGLFKGNLDLTSNKSVIRMENNPWVAPIADQLQVGLSHVIDYLRSETYKL